ncbi:MAG TPA: PadR family transcriptional regulator [Gemmatimonadaceae bacterium]
MNDNRDVVQGTLDLLILSSLRGGAMHGWGISRRIRERSGDVVLVTTGSLYPALHRLESRRLVKAEWRISDNNRRAKYYQLTARGERTLADEIAWWNRFVVGVAGIIAPA